MPEPALQLVRDDGTHYEIERLRKDLAAAKRMLAAAHEELEAERDARQKYYQANERLKAQMVKHQAQVVVEEQVQHVFSMYRVIAGKSRRYQLGPRRQKLIGEFLQWGDYLEHEIKQAFMAIPYEQDKFPKVAHNYTLEFVLRDETNFERFRDSYISHWAQFEFRDVDRERLDRFAKGTDPASVMEAA